jgi:hypothetical protein
MRLVLLSLLLLGASVTPILAQEHARGARRPREAQDQATLLTDVEIKLVRDYYAVPAARPKPLPPGAAKNLARGKPLPPGIAKTRLPQALLLRLPPRPGFELVLVGHDLVLLDRVGVVVDIRIGIF